MTQACRPLLSHSGCPMNDRLLTDRLCQWFSLFDESNEFQSSIGHGGIGVFGI